MALDPYARLDWRGVVANRRTIEMLEITELRSELGTLRIPQGSYSTGVSASGGTHAGGGALDISVRDMTTAERDHVVWALRKTSFAAWYRPYLAGVWPAHIHAIAIGDKELSAAAAEQVVQYRNGLNGLANHGPDNGPNVPITVYRQDVDMSYYGPEKWDQADFDRFAAKTGWGKDLSNLNSGGTSDAGTLLSFAHQHATDGDVQATAANKKADQALTLLEEIKTAVVLPPVPPV